MDSDRWHKAEPKSPGGTNLTEDPIALAAEELKDQHRPVLARASTPRFEEQSSELNLINLNPFSSTPLPQYKLHVPFQVSFNQISQVFVRVSRTRNFQIIEQSNNLATAIYKEKLSLRELFTCCLAQSKPGKVVSAVRLHIGVNEKKCKRTILVKGIYGSPEVVMGFLNAFKEAMESTANAVPPHSRSSNIMATSGAKDIDAVTLATIKLKSQEREYEIVDDPIGRIKLKNYSSDDSSLAQEKPLNVYYCALCGAYNLVTTQSLASLKVRRTDRAIIVPGDGKVGFQRYFAAGEVVVLRRQAKGLEKQWRWVCKDCGVLLGYQLLPHAHQFPSELSKPSTRLPRTLQSQTDRPPSYPVPCCIYLLDKAFATDSAYCALVRHSIS